LINPLALLLFPLERSALSIILRSGCGGGLLAAAGRFGQAAAAPPQAARPDAGRLGGAGGPADRQWSRDWRRNMAIGGNKLLVKLLHYSFAQSTITKEISMNNLQ